MASEKREAEPLIVRHADGWTCQLCPGWGPNGEPHDSACMFGEEVRALEAAVWDKAERECIRLAESLVIGKRSLYTYDQLVFNEAHDQALRDVVDELRRRCAEENPDA